MKWIMVEIEWNGKEHEMPTVYDRLEDAEKDRQIFYSVNPHKTCVLTPDNPKENYSSQIH